MPEQRGIIAGCRIAARNMIGGLEMAVGAERAASATMALVEYLAALERLDNDIVENGKETKR